MTTRKSKLELNERAASTESAARGVPKVTPGEPLSLQRSKLEWDEMMLDYTAIERRAQEMRSEAAWAIAGSVRDWTMNLFRLGKAKAHAAVQAPLQSRIQSS